MAEPVRPTLAESELAQLGRDVVAAAYLTGRFVLRSGAISNYYFDKYRLTTRPALLRRVGVALAALVSPGVDRIAGPELGAVPLATAVSLETGIPSVFVRKTAKGYGTDRGFEGEIAAGERVLVVEDVLTTGSEAIRAATALRDFGAEVVEILGVIDREEGAAANIAAAGFRFRALFSKSSLGL
ncbi:MAG: orotate phosphoribosyltransferase [Chloroflexota bacterium]|nr:orotate phosphoribosyltransferase [Chloroflexota bacterium]